MDEAKSHLIKAGNSPGSPQMDTFGPNMALARDLLLVGEREVVIEYFRLCRKFWDHERGQLELWEKQVEKGEIPAFGPNLVY